MPRVRAEASNVRIHNQTPNISAIEESKVTADEMPAMPLSKSGLNFVTKDKNYSRDEPKDKKGQKQKAQFLANKLLSFRNKKKSSSEQQTPENQSKLRR